LGGDGTAIALHGDDGHRMKWLRTVVFLVEYTFVVVLCTLYYGGFRPRFSKCCDCLVLAILVTALVCCFRANRRHPKIPKRVPQVPRLFGPPGARGTVHARWFVFGLWLTLMPITTMRTTHPYSRCLGIWLGIFVGTWALRWFRPRWDPAALMRVSLFTSGVPFLWMATGGVLPRLHCSSFGKVAFGAMTLALVWGLHERLTLVRLYAGNHPWWVLGERMGDQHSIRGRASVAVSYRTQACGAVVGFVPAREQSASIMSLTSLRTAGRTILSVGVFAVYAFLFMLLV
jgi:hypothetical protein